MHYNILFNGCSFTYGGELDGIDRDLEHQRTHRFSHLVAKHYGKTYDNISANGKSNDWIIEQTINWFEEGNTCDLTVIQFTKQRRLTQYNDDDKNTQPKEYDICRPILQTDKSPYALHCKSANFVKKRILANIYYKNIYTEYTGQQNYYKNLFFLNNYFKTKNIPAIFLRMELDTGVDFGWKLHCKNIKVKSIVGDIIPASPNSYWLDREHGFHLMDDCIEKKYYCPNYRNTYTKSDKYGRKSIFLNPNHIFLNGTHPNEFGHQKIADYIIDNSSNIF